MKESIRFKLETVRDRFEEIAGLLADPDVIADQNQFRDLSREYAQLEPVVNCYQDYTSARDNLQSAEEMLADKDPEMREMAVEEKATASEQVNSLETELQKLLLPKDPNDDNNIFLEIRAGTGGERVSRGLFLPWSGEEHQPHHGTPVGAARGRPPPFRCPFRR